MKNKKGFTLIELLIVIGLISLLMILFMPSILGIGTKIKTETYDNKVTLIETAAENFIVDNSNAIKGNSQVCVTIEYLIKNGYLFSDNTDGTYIIDPVTNERMSGKAVLEYYQDSNGVWRAKATYSNDPTCYTVIKNTDVYSSKYQVSGTDVPNGNSVVINDSAATTASLDVKLTISNTSGTATEMCISNTTTCDSFMWVEYNTIVPHWTLDSANGSSTKTVYVKFRDSNGATSPNVSDTIVYQDGIPKITFTPLTNTTYQKTQTVALRVDSITSITTIRYSWGTSKLTSMTTTSGTGLSFTVAPTVNQSIVGTGLTGTYYLCVYAKNGSGFEATSCSNAFYFDNIVPTVSVNYSATTAKTHNPIITSSDSQAGLRTLKYSWSTSQTTASGGTSISSGSAVTSLSSVSGTYYLCIYAEDMAGNMNNTYYSYIYANSAPTFYSFSINNGASTTTTTIVNLYSSVVNATQMCFSNSYNNNICNGNWSSYSSIFYNWYLNGGSSGTYGVYAWYKDNYGNSTSYKYDDIYYSAAIYPSGSFTINYGAQSTTSPNVNLSISASNTTSMCVSNYGSCTPNMSYTSSVGHTISGIANSYNTVYITLASATGNTVMISNSIYYSVPVASRPVISSNLVDGGWYPANTYVTTSCSSPDAPITSFYVHDNSSRFPANHGYDDPGHLINDGTYYKANIIQMASASSYYCYGTCTYYIDATCSNSAGTTTQRYTFELGLTW